MDINEQIRANRGLIYQQLNRFNLQYDQDAESYAYEALHRAILTYDASTGNVFSTYAVCVIANALRKHLRTLNKKRQLDVVSYNGGITEDNESDSLIEVIRHPDAESDPEAMMLFTELRGEVGKAYRKVFSSLSEKHQSIITAWYNSDYKMTQSEIAKALRVSQPTVSKALSVFKYKLKLELEEYM